MLRLRGAGGQRGGAPQLVLRPRAKIDMGTDSPDALHNMTGRNMKRRGKETGYSEKDISFFGAPSSNSMALAWVRCWVEDKVA